MLTSHRNHCTSSSDGSYSQPSSIDLTFVYGTQEGCPRGVREDDLARSDGALRALRAPRIETSPRRAEPIKAEQRVSARVSARVVMHRSRCQTL